MRKWILMVLASLFLFPTFVVQAASAPKTWTFLIFLNGNNNLDYFGKKNIIDMERVGSNDQVNIVVQWASLERRAVYRMLITKSKKHDRVRSPIVEKIGNADMGDVNTLKNFIAWGVKNYPAEHYFINVWDHGQGWHDVNHQRSIGDSFDISHDEITGHEIKTEELGQALGYAAQLIGHKVDVYGSDACLMAMAEVANEMADSVSYFVGSEEVEPGDGWPYNKLLANWEALPSRSPADVASIVVAAYHAYYKKTYSETTMSAYDMTKLPALNAAVAKLSVELGQLNAQDRKAVVTEMKNTQRFASPDYADLRHFVKLLSALKLHTVNAGTLNEVDAAVAQLVIANGSKIRDAYGVAIWLPESQYDMTKFSARYKGLQFDGITHWEAALSSLLQGVS